MHQLPFSHFHSKSTVAFHRIHSDVWGPSPCKSLDGYQYYVSFIDECTGFVWLYPLHNKSKVFAKFVHFYALVSNHFSAFIKFF